MNILTSSSFLVAPDERCSLMTVKGLIFPTENQLPTDQIELGVSMLPPC